MTRRPHFIMLGGVPATGKSTHRATLMEKYPDAFVYSTDDRLKEIAASRGVSYGDLPMKEHKQAKAHMNAKLKEAINKGMDIIWDQTNFLAHVRRNRHDMIPNTYTKELFFFHCRDDEEIKRRISERTEQQVPWHVVANMIERLELPGGDDEVFEKFELIDTTPSSTDGNSE
jgi:tRNA uridine 5-carbamoylmethylation protein Kti12